MFCLPSRPVSYASASYFVLSELQWQMNPSPYVLNHFLTQLKGNSVVLGEYPQGNFHIQTRPPNEKSNASRQNIDDSDVTLPQGKMKSSNAPKRLFSTRKLSSVQILLIISSCR